MNSLKPSSFCTFSDLTILMFSSGVARPDKRLLCKSRWPQEAGDGVAMQFVAVLFLCATPPPTPAYELRLWALSVLENRASIPRKLWRLRMVSLFAEGEGGSCHCWQHVASVRLHVRHCKETRILLLQRMVGVEGRETNVEGQLEEVTRTMSW